MIKRLQQKLQVLKRYTTLVFKSFSFESIKIEKSLLYIEVPGNFKNHKKTPKALFCPASSLRRRTLPVDDRVRPAKWAPPPPVCHPAILPISSTRLIGDFIVINSSYAQKSLEIFVELPFGHTFMSAKFEIHWMNRTVAIFYVCYTMARFTIFFWLKSCMNVHDICSHDLSVYRDATEKVWHALLDSLFFA